MTESASSSLLQQQRQQARIIIRQERALAITPKVTSTVSISCSVFLIYEIWCDYKKGGGGKDSTPIGRILVGMSVIDILSSSAWFLSSWAVPKGSFAFSTGNRASCNYQGFLLQLAIGAPLYNCSLALFYLLMIKYRWTDDRLALLEKWVHLSILGFSIGTAVFLLPLELYNHVGAVCWIIGEPQQCGDSSFRPNPQVPCERGNHAWIYGLATFYGPLWFCVIVCGYFMVEIYRQHYRIMGSGSNNRRRRSSRKDNKDGSSVRSTAGGGSHGGTAPSPAPRGSGSGSSGDDDNSRRIALQAILFTVSFFITWLPSTLWSIAHWFNFHNYWLDLASAVCEPLQGLWNFAIFVRNRKETRKKVNLFLSRLFPCCIKHDPELYNSRHGGRFESATVAWTSSAVSSTFMLASNPNAAGSSSAAAGARAPPSAGASTGRRALLGANDQSSMELPERKPSFLCGPGPSIGCTGGEDGNDAKCVDRAHHCAGRSAKMAQRIAERVGRKTVASNSTKEALEQKSEPFGTSSKRVSFLIAEDEEEGESSSSSSRDDDEDDVSGEDEWIVFDEQAVATVGSSSSKSQRSPAAKLAWRRTQSGSLRSSSSQDFKMPLPQADARNDHNEQASSCFDDSGSSLLPPPPSLGEFTLKRMISAMDEEGEDDESHLSVAPWDDPIGRIEI